LLDDPHQLAAEQLKDASVAVSSAMDWQHFADRHVPHTELQRRRAEPGPLAGLALDPGAAARWVETGTSEEHAA
jgi:hypothetical protein